MLKKFIYSLLNQASTYFAGFIILMLLSRKSTPADLSSWVLYQSIFIVVSTPVYTFVSDGFNRFFWEDEKGNQIFFAGMFLNLVFAAVCSLIVYALRGSISLWLNNAALEPLLSVFPLHLMSTSVYRFFLMYNNARMRPLHSALLNMIYSGLVLLSVTFMLLYANSLQFVNILYLMSCSAFAAAIMGVYFIERSALATPVISKRFILKIAHFGIFGFLKDGFLYLAPQLSLWVVAIYLTGSQASLLGVVWRMVPLMLLPNMAAQILAFPYLSRLATGNPPCDMKIKAEKITGYILAMNIPVLIFIFVFAGPILSFIFGEFYAQGQNILRIFALVTLIFTPIGNMYGIVIKIVKKPHIDLVTSASFSCLGVVLLICMVRYKGLMGAPISEFTTKFIAVIVSILLMNKYMDFRISRVLKYIPEPYEILIAKVQSGLLATVKR